MTMITPSYLGETIEYSSLHACRSTLEDPTKKFSGDVVIRRRGAAKRHEVGGRLNNRAENSHQPFRRRERAMQRFRSMKTLQKIQLNSC